ncbi:iron chelate uptake ABC transporter family permease subunit [uncultured Clostridium sp.]|uniref:iron chelate uptake ABC transporter family permease subunit n=1 Tax=uncultured Clostridium sp. TaxID=59620 RepID=UPI002629D9A5|nr:iron chelate uptake ABC transporter family permease subunit [uncultured Clostridium sp.]
MKDKKKIYILAGLVFIMIGVFLFEGLTPKNFDYNISKRIPRVIAMVITASAIAFSSVIFQTITNNRILTPSILGIDSLYGLSQTALVFAFGSGSIFIANPTLNFGLSVILMMLNSLLLYKFVFKKSGNIFFLLLVGTVLGTLFKSMSTFMQVLIDPNEYDALTAKIMASFESVNTDILLVVVIICLVIFAFIYDDIKKYDVLLLGKEQAINLGINYEKMAKKTLLIVSILVSVSIALVGPITFLGLLVVNLSYQFIKTYEHKYVIVASMLISILAVITGQFFVERIFNYNSTVSIIINFIGGVYFIYLLLKESKS